MIQTVIKRDGRVVGYNEEKSKPPSEKPCFRPSVAKTKPSFKK